MIKLSCTQHVFDSRIVLRFYMGDFLKTFWCSMRAGAVRRPALSVCKRGRTPHIPQKSDNSNQNSAASIQDSEPGEDVAQQQRNPQQLNQFPGLYPKRAAERANFWSLYQLPPRNTRPTSSPPLKSSRPSSGE